MRPTIDLSYADEVEIEDKFNPWSKIIITQHGRVSSIDDVAEEFGVEAKLAQKEKEVWALKEIGFEPQVEIAEAPAAKRARLPKRSVGGSGGDAQGSHPTALSQVLQQRLSEKMKAGSK